MTSIGDYAFQECTSLISIEIPNSVTSIEWGCFYGCSGLTSVTIGNSVTSIGINAFSSCTGLTSIEIPSSVTVVNATAFDGCTSINNVIIEDSEIPLEFSYDGADNDGLFYGCPISSLYLGRNIECIDFDQNSSYLTPFGINSLKKISIGNNVTSINPFDFFGSNISSIVVDKGNPKYDSRDNSDAIIETATNTIIMGCMNTNIPNSVTRIGDSAFCGCMGLTTIEIPNTVNTIGWDAFFGCVNLSNLIIKDGDIPLNFTGFERFTQSGSPGGINDCPITTLYLGRNIGYKVHEDMNSNVTNSCSWFTLLKKLIIGNQVTYIGRNEFNFCRDLTSVISRIEKPFVFGESAFYYISENCKLIVPYGTRNAYIAAGWTNNVFRGGVYEESAPLLNNIAFADANVKALCVANWDTNSDGELSKAEAAAVTDLGEVFKGNTEITSFNELQYFTKLTIIGAYAFHMCSNLKSLTIPNSVISIGKGAFDGADLSIVISLIENPSTIYDKTSDYKTFSLNTFNNATLFVPKGTISKYTATTGWKDFTNIVEGTGPNGDEEDAVVINGIYYNLINEDGIAEVIENPNKYTGDVVIPKSVTYKNVNYSVTSICGSAFRGCYGLTSVTIPNSVTSMGKDAFLDCTGLQKVIVSDIAAWCGIYFGNAKDNPLYWAKHLYSDKNTEIKNLVIPNSVKSISFAAFSNCSGLTSVTIPNSVTNIKKSAFCYCSGLTSVTIPNSVTSIGDYAFVYCSKLTSVTIPNSVTSIGKGVFYYCTSMSSVTSEIKNPFAFGENAFSNISSSCTLTVPKGTKEAYIASGWTEDIFKGGIVEAETFNPDSPNIIFADANVKALCVANWDTNGDGELSKAEAAAVTDLGEVFKGNTKITSFNELQYFTGLSTIGSDSFGWCYGLTSLSIPNSVTSIGGYAFYACTGLTSITIPNSLTSIGDYAFYGCTGLTSITIPNSVTSIGDSAFRNCSGLTSVTVGNSVTSIAVMAFCDCRNLTSIIIPNSVTSIGAMAFWNTAWYSNQPDGLVYAGLVAYKYKGTMPDNTKIQLRSNTIGIGYGAFQGYTGLTSITIPNSVTDIEHHAFSGCTGLTSITIPNSVTSIGSSAFYDCTSMSSVISEIKSPFAFGESAFSNISSSCTLTVPKGTKEAYIAAGWTEDVFKGGIIEEEQTDPNILTIADLDIVETVQVKYITEVGSSYEGGKAEFNIASVLSKLPAGDVKIYAVQSNGTLDANYESGPYDGWHNADGDWERWGTSATVFCVKADFTLQKDPIYYIAGYSEGTHLTRAINYSVKYAFVGPNNEAIILNVIIAYVNYKIGDVNGDGKVSVTDVVMMISHILQKNPVGFNKDAADMNGDGRISVTDVTIAIAKVLRVK